MFPIVDPIARLVLVVAEPAVAEVAGDQVGDGPLLARRARQLGELAEEVEDLRGHL
jgi:hypothetical protein